MYLGCRAASEDHLTDSTGQRPRYSLRSLTRSLQTAKSFLAIGEYASLCLSISLGALLTEPLYLTSFRNPPVLQSAV
jgi:midasin (ATPase involved in ribosome maturation)